MNKGVLTIDLKNRIFRDSIILDVSPIKGNEPMELKLDIERSLNKVKEYIKDGNIEESEKELEKIAPYLEVNANHKLYNEYCICDTVSFNICEVIRCMKEKKGELDNFLIIRSIYYYLISFRVSNDISCFEETYDKYLSEIEAYIKSYNLFDILCEFKENIMEEEKTAYIMHMTDQLEDVYLYDDEEKKILEELKEYITFLREKYINKYNHKEEVNDVIKFLTPYEYRKIILDDKFIRYKNMLQDSYENYSDLNEDFRIIYELYELNNCKEYNNYYNIIINLPLREIIMLSDYARQYIIRKLFEKNKNYYSVIELQNDIKELIKTLNIKKNTNVIPL